MDVVDVIRAWKDVEYRLDLQAEQRALLPEHPAGEVELDDIDGGYQYDHLNLTISRSEICDLC